MPSGAFALRETSVVTSAVGKEGRGWGAACVPNAVKWRTRKDATFTM